ncbi:MAG: cupredoxin domain-containing protein [Chloroflexota bacterium]|nr:cupredoxin domain-containing protein [Chloroflexota bacterium]
MKITTLAATGLLLLALVGCSGSGSATNTPAGNPSTVPAASAAASNAPASSSPAASAAATDATATDATAMTVKDFTLEPKDVTVQGDVNLAVTNAGPTIHNVKIRDAAGTDLGGTKDLKSGESETFTVSIPAGTYTFYCSLPGHESLGIKGTLTVTK